MKNILLASLVCLVALSSCNWHRIRGNGTVKTETRNVASFEAVECDGTYDIQINCQKEQSVTLETDENLLPLVRTEVHGRTLRIYTKGILLPTNQIHVTIAVPNINEFTCSGSSQGEINNMNNDEFKLDINGSAKMHLDGKSGSVGISISGSSRIDASSLISENSKIHINGSGHINVYATNSVDVQINGSGTVKYKGEPKSVNQQINGSGKIEKE